MARQCDRCQQFRVTDDMQNGRCIACAGEVYPSVNDHGTVVTVRGNGGLLWHTEIGQYVDEVADVPVFSERG